MTRISPDFWGVPSLSPTTRRYASDNRSYRRGVETSGYDRYLPGGGIPALDNAKWMLKPDKEGQSIASARSAILAIPGVASAKFTLKGAYNGFQKEWTEKVEIDLKPGFQPKDTAAFIDYIVSTMWSINEHNPTAGIGIVLTTTPQVNLDAVGKSAGWTYLVTFADQPSIVVTDSVSLKKQLGEWPGTPPKKTDKTAMVQVPAVQPGQ